jgi:SAM-dependent methyltransferase
LLTPRHLDLLAGLARSHHARSYWLLRLIRPRNLFQPFSDTYPDRYPDVFGLVRDQLADGSAVRILSFGCSTGEEVFSLRRYFPSAQIRGLDINPLNVAICRRRQRSGGDGRMSFGLAGSVESEAADFYDAVFAMAVFRHGDVSQPHVDRCDDRITFESFERTVGDLARCVKDDGLLIIQHSNFRFRDTAASAGFRTILTLDNREFAARTPVFGSDNRRIEEPQRVDVVFQKIAGPETGPGVVITPPA